MGALDDLSCAISSGSCDICRGVDLDESFRDPRRDDLSPRRIQIQIIIRTDNSAKITAAMAIYRTVSLPMRAPPVMKSDDRY